MTNTNKNSSPDELVERLNKPLVIEYAVPLPVHEVLQQAADERGEAAARIQSDASRLATAKEALTFYANEWDQDVDAELTANGWEGSIGEMEATPALIDDAGSRARTALASIKGSES